MWADEGGGYTIVFYSLAPHLLFVFGSQPMMQQANTRPMMRRGTKQQANGTRERHRARASSVAPTLFNIGASKTGTSTVHVMASHLLCTQCCHYVCPDQWDLRSQRHDAAALASHRCYNDNGQYSDWQWLDRHFPKARFAMSIRAPDAWNTSLFKHLRKARLEARCSAIGDDSSCQAVASSGNDASRMRVLVRELTHHQQQVLRYFGSSAERRRRFAVLDLFSDSPHEVWLTLIWLMRRDLSEYEPAQLVRSARQLPAAFRATPVATELQARRPPLPHISFTSGLSATAPLERWGTPCL